MYRAPASSEDQAMSADCLFCKIAAKQIPSKMVYEDADIFAFEDISPQAPTHILLIPRKHFVSLDDATHEDQAVIGKLSLPITAWSSCVASSSETKCFRGINRIWVGACGLMSS